MENASSKEQQWQQMAERIARVTDGLGKGVDNGIKDTVIVLNLLRIHTTASCEGHLEWGTCAPWVDIDVSGLHEEDQRYLTAMKDAQKQRESGQLPKEEVRQLFAEVHQLRKEAKQKHLEERRKVIPYLTAFYQTHVVAYDRQLIVWGLGLGTTRIESLGADFQEVTPLETRLQKLEEYQEEMRAFTEFLREIWLAKNETDDV